MAGLYDDLPEPCSQPQVQAEEPEAPQASAASDLDQLLVRPENAGASKLFSLDDVTLLHTLGFLGLPEIGNSLPSVCPLLHFLRGSWPLWRRFAAPLRKPRIHLTQLLSLRSRSLSELADLAEALGQTAAVAFKGCRPRLPSFATDPHALSYSELPLPRVVWSLHNEGLSKWRRVCSATVDAEFALLPPWDRAPRRNFLPKKVQLLLGVSLWLPPQEVEAEHSFPVLYMNVALAEPQHFEALAERHPEQPPCLAATCDALLLRLPDFGRATTLEEWNLLFSFGQEGYRHSGHGELEGYRKEIQSPGRRRWRPPDLCFARAGEERTSEGLRVLLRSRRCLGLLE